MELPISESGESGIGGCADIWSAGREIIRRSFSPPVSHRPIASRALPLRAGFGRRIWSSGSQSLRFLDRGGGQAGGEGAGGRDGPIRCLGPRRGNVSRCGVNESMPI